MKTILILLSISFLFASTGCEKKSDPLTPEEIIIIGYIVGDNGIIYKSTDGGENWFQLNSGTSNKLKAVYSISTNETYAVGDGGKIIKTSNGGTTWSAQNSGTNVNLNSIYFIPGTLTGYIAGDGGTILKTTDGGDLWSNIASIQNNKENYN